MDYYKIGQRIRKYRKAFGMSQDELSEKIGISITHMSHIETGNTKLSLPVLVSLAEVLEVRIDDLLFDSSNVTRSVLEQEMLDIVADCSTQHLEILLDVLQATKIALNKHL